MNAILILNPKSGKQKISMPPIFKWTFKKLKKKVDSMSHAKTTPGKIVQAVRKACLEGNIALDVKFTKRPKDATVIAKKAKDKYDLIIVAGGDGTINEVINGIIGSKTPLAIIPFGTVNLLAMQLKIPLDVIGAANLITNGKKKKIDLGYAKTTQEGRYYSIVLGVGFVPRVMENVDLKTKKKFGKLAFVITTIKELFQYQWPTIHVKHSSHSYGYFIIVSNTKDYSGEFEIAQKARMTDGLLDLVVINRRDLWGIFKFLFKTGTGIEHTFLKGEYYQVKEAHINSWNKLFVQVDGEVIGMTPVSVKVVPKALTVMVK